MQNVTKTLFIDQRSSNFAKKKVALIGSYAGSLISFRGNLLLELQSKNYEIIVLLPDINQHPKVASRLNEMGIKFYEFSLKGNQINIFYDLKSLVSIFLILKQKEIDTLILYTIKPVIYGSLVGKILGISKIFSMVTGVGFVFTKNHSFKQRMLKCIVQILYKIAFLFNKKVFFQNSDDLKLFCEMKLVEGEKTVSTNGSGVDLDFYAPLPRITKGVNFLFAGRLLGNKGIREFISAAEQFKTFNSKTTFSVCGWIDQSPDAITPKELDTWIEKGIIKFLGKMDDIRPAIAKSSVFVLPSYREGTPRSVLEAMSMGKPIITCDVPGCRETVLNGINGYLVTHKSVYDLMKAMKKFLSNPKLISEMGINSRLIAIKKFNVKDVNKVILETIETS